MAIIWMTGASGFIGKKVAARLTQQGHTVLAMIRNASKLDALKATLDLEAANRLIPIQGDLSQKGFALGPMDAKKILDAEIIIHAGGPMDVDLDEATARRTFLDGASELMDVAERIRNAGGGLRHFIHVVGYMSPFNEDNWRNEPDAYDKINEFMSRDSAYERMKFLADLLIRQRAARMMLPLSVVNPSVVIGDKKSGEIEQTGGLGILVDAVRKGLMPVIPGGSHYWIPMISRDDVAEMIVALAEIDNPSNHTYAVMEERSDSPNMKELTQWIADGLRVPKPKLSIPFSVLKAVMSSGIGKMTGISAHSLSFLSQRDFDTKSYMNFKSSHGLVGTDLKRIMPFVIADLDDRLSRTAPSATAGWIRSRIGNLAALHRVGADDRKDRNSQSTGTVWVLLHGMFSRSDDLVSVASLWKEESVWLPDLPGLGRSPYAHTKDVFAGTVEAVVAALKEFPGTIRLVGHSIGALVALEAYRKLPDKIDKLILLQPPVRPPEWPLYARQLDRILAAPGLVGKTLLSVASFRNFLADTGAFSAASAIPDGYVHKLKAGLTSPRTRKTNGDWVHWLLRNYQGIHDAELDHPNIHVLWGTLDKAYREPEIRNITRLPFGHQFPIESPEQTAEAIEQLGR